MNSVPGAKLKYEKDGYRIYECDKTGTMFVHPQPSQEELNKIYSSGYFTRGNKYTPPAGDRNADPQYFNDQRKLGLLKKFASSGKLLDLGSAMGGFLAVAKDAGFDVEGLEVSSYGAEYTERELKIKVYNSDLPSAKLPSACYDIVTMWDVIEHLRDLDATMAEVSRILKPGGLLFVTTGDIGSPYAKLMGRRWHLLTPPQHLFYFTKKGLSDTLAKHGLGVQEIVHLGKHASLDFALFKAEESFGGIAKGIRKLAQKTGLYRKKLYINLGDIMTAVARKD